jgi:translation elongation factor EF-Ts
MYVHTNRVIGSFIVNTCTTKTRDLTQTITMDIISSNIKILNTKHFFWKEINIQTRKTKVGIRTRMTILGQRHINKSHECK